jgi:ribonuclease P protein component
LTGSACLAIRVQRRFRLTSSNDYLRVRRAGKSFAHPLVVLVALPNHLGYSRFAVSAGRRVGKAIKRNRAKRLLREAIRSQFNMIAPGWDVVMVARQPLPEARFQEVDEAVKLLLLRAHLIEVNNNDAS